MQLNTMLADLKKEPGYSDNVGMILIHNGTVRGRSRDGKPVRSVIITPDMEKLYAICKEKEQQPGIFRILAHAKTGEYAPGEDVLYLIVAGDIREHVKATLADLLDTIKAEAMHKQELYIA